MNSIVKKVLLVLAIIFGLYTAVLYSFVKLVIAPSFNGLQEAAAVDEVNRCRLIVNKEIAITRSLCSDWATWDDSYAFIVDRNPDFIKSNLDIAALKSSKTNAVIFIDNLGQVVWGKTYDLSTGTELYVPQFSPESIRKSRALYSQASLDSGKSGLILINGVPTVVASCPMVTSKREGPVRGTLLMARFLSDSDIKDLAASLGTSFSIVAAGKAEFVPISGQGNAIRQRGGKRLQICQIFNDIFGQPTMAIIADVPTPIAAKGRMVGWLISFSVVVAGALTLVVTFLLLKAIVMRRIESLGHTIEALANAGEDAPAGNRDELARHAEMVMRVVGRLDTTEHALDASYQRFWSAFFNAPFPIIIHNDDGKVLQVNRKWTALTGYALADIPTVGELCRKASCDGSRELRKSIETVTVDPNSSGEVDVCTIRTSDGADLKWSLTSFSLGKTDSGGQQIISMAVDMTENVESRQTYRDSESLFKALSEAIPAVTYTAEFTSDAFLTYISPQVGDILGRQPADIRNSADPWRLIISAEDYRGAMEGRFAAISQKRTFICDYHGKSASGETILLHEEARLVNTAKGPMIQGVIFDAAASLWPKAAAAAAGVS